MKGRWIPLLASISCLALAAVAPAQRGRGGSSGGGGGGRSSSGPLRSGGDSRPSRSSGGDFRPSRSSGGDTRAPRSSGGDFRPNRSSDSRPSRSPIGDSRPFRSDDRSSRTRDDRSSGAVSRPFGSSDRDTRFRDIRGGERHSIFEREIGRDRDVRTGAERGRTIGGVSVGGYGRRGGYGGGPVYSRPGRTGTGLSTGFHNGYGNVSPVRYGGGFNHAVLGVQINRNRPHAGFNADFRFGGVYGGLRYGYVGYAGYGDCFAYPFYAYDPWSVAVVASPWYRYSYLPPYLDTNRVTIINNYNSVYDGGSDWRDYDYRADDRSSRNDELNDALGDIQDAFERNSDRYAERLLPDSGQVAIFNEGKYDYSLGPDDFKDMFLDGIEQSKTIRYEIVESRVRGDEVHLRARHEYTDSFGADQTVYHTYTLRRENGRYVIREFGTD